MNKNFSSRELKEVVTVDEFLMDQQYFGQVFNKLVEERNIYKLVKFLEEFFEMYPLSRSLLIEIYNQSMNHYGLTGLAHEAIRIFLKTNQRILDNGKSLFGLPPIVESTWMLARIGELADQTAYVSLMLKLGRLNQKPVLPVTRETAIANKGFLVYLNDTFELLTKPKDVEFFTKHTHNAPYNTVYYHYSESDYGHNSGFFNACDSDLIRKNIRHNAFTLKDVTIESAVSFLKKYGLNEQDPFIVLHLRESGYLDANHHNLRNVDVTTYNEAINWFIQQGFKVVRIGHKKMSKLESRVGLIDLTAVDRIGEVDIFLCAKAVLYFGTGSGPYSLSYNFGVPTAQTAVLPYGRTRRHGIVQYMSLVETKSNMTLNFDQISEFGLFGVFSPSVFESLNISPIYPSSAQNLKFAKEAIDYIHQRGIYQENERLRSERDNIGILGGLWSEDLEKL